MGIDVRQSFWRSVWTGYVFWTLFASLPALIWFYPLNQLEITFYELFILVLLVPITLRCQRTRIFLQSDMGDLLLKTITLLGILSFRSPTILLRLILLAIGTGAALLKFGCDLTVVDIGKKKYAFWGYAVGFMALLSTRVWYRSIMPAFNDDTTNLLVFLVTFLNAMATMVSFDRHSLIVQRPTNVQENNPTDANFALVSLGAGSLFFVIHSVFGEISTPFRWINGPFPDDVGPQPMPWQLAIYLALLIGFYLSSKLNLVFNPRWSFTGALGYWIMYTNFGWRGFLGAIILAVYVTSIWPTYMDLLFRRLPANKVGPALALAMVTYILEALYSVWTVAYNFVPLGEYTREATGYLIFVVTALISIGIYWHKEEEEEEDIASEDHLAFTHDQNGTKVSRSRVWSRFIFLAILTFSAIKYRYYGWDPGHTNDQAVRNNFTAMVWTYHFGYDNQGWPSLTRTTDLIESLQADVIGLLETDASRLYMGNNDLAQYLAETLNMYVDFGPNTRRHTWGSMLLSRFPIIRSHHHLLPSPRGELAPAISAVLNVSGVAIGVVVTHFGNDRDNEDRKLQALAVAEITSTFYNEKIPTVFLGYVTSIPYSRDYNTLVEKGHMKDIDDSDGDRFCEYIFYNRLHRLAYARISHSGLSDTEIQAAKFMVPDEATRKAKNFHDHYSILTDQLDKIPANQRLPAAFGGFYSGHYRGAGHHYHMFTPKYFRPK